MQYLLTKDEYEHLKGESAFRGANYDKYIKFLGIVAKLEEASDMPLQYKKQFCEWIEQARKETIDK